METIERKMQQDDSEWEIPEHTKQATKAAFGLLFYSFLMFSLPFGAFFGTQSLLRHYLQVDGFANVGWSVFAVVITVHAILISYMYKAYHETEYDESGRVLDDSYPGHSGQSGYKQD